MKPIWNDQDAYQLVHTKSDKKLSCSSVYRAIKIKRCYCEAREINEIPFQTIFIMRNDRAICILLSVTLSKQESFKIPEIHCNKMEGED